MLLLKLILVVFALHATVVLSYEQTDYTVIFERIEVAGINNRHAGMIKTHNFKYNRTQAVMNCTFDFKTAFGNDLRMSLQAFKFASNEYRLFPISFDINLCDVLKRNDFGVDNIYDCGTFPRCPMAKGIFYICNWLPDYSKFPPYVPTGRYKFVANATYHSESVYQMEIYIAVEKIFKL